ncbi:MAG: alpha/beta hydrolase-fold protein [Bacteroidota bacterium]
MLRLLSLVLLLVPLADALAQPTSEPETEVFRLDGPSGAYDIEVTFPARYDRAGGEALPTLYFLDGWRNAALIRGIHRIAMTTRVPSLPSEVRPFLLVGVTAIGGETAFQVSRNKDLTPTPFIPPRGVTFSMGDAITLDSASTGGAEPFHAFLRDEVIPEVESRYPSDPAQRAYAGHSFGGLFGAWMMTTHPETFADYLLLSPSLFWDRGYLVDASFAAVGARGARVFIGAGDAERGGMGDIATRAERFASVLNSTPGVEATLRIYEGAGHQGVLAPGFWDGILALYGEPGIMP